MKLNEQINRIRKLIGLNENYDYDNDDYDETETEDETHFRSKLTDEEKMGTVSYTGRNITWFGTKGRSAIIPIHLIDCTEGNIYDQDKLESLYNQINNLPTNIELLSSYCSPYPISILDVKEEQQAHQQDRFEIDYDGRETPLTTGDDELDVYVGSYYDLDDVIESSYYAPNLFKKYHTDIAQGKKTFDQMKTEFEALMEDDDTYREEIEEGLREFIGYEQRLQEAINNEDGDIGTMRFQLRDGNHRFNVAKQLNEQYILCDIARSSQISVEEVSHFVKIL